MAHEHQSGVVMDGGIAPVWDPANPDHKPTIRLPWGAVLRSFHGGGHSRTLAVAVWDKEEVVTEQDNLIGEGFITTEQLELAEKHRDEQHPALAQMSVFLAAPKNAPFKESESDLKKQMHSSDGGSSGKKATRMGGDSAGQLFIRIKFISAIDPRGAFLEVQFLHAIGLKDAETRTTTLNDSYDPTLLLMWLPIMVVYLGIGILYYYFACEFKFIDACYFCFVTFTTVGYGDHGDMGDFYTVVNHNSDGDEVSLPGDVTAAFTSFFMLAGVLVMGVAATLVLDLGSFMTTRAVKWVHQQEHRFAACFPQMREEALPSEDGEIEADELPLTPKEKLVMAMHSLKTGLCNPAFVDVFITIIAVIVLLIAAGIFYAVHEGATFFQGFYFACATCTTVGYGDLSPSEDLTKVLALFLLPVGSVLTAKMLGDMSGVLFRVQSMKMERAVMKQFGSGIKFQDFADLKMQIGSDGANPTITKNEFLLAMIMRLGRLREDDKALIEMVYHELDADQSGFLDISDCTLGSTPTSVLIEHGVLNDEDWEADGVVAQAAPAAVVAMERRKAVDQGGTVHERELWHNMEESMEHANVHQLKSALEAAIERIRYLETAAKAVRHQYHIDVTAAEISAEVRLERLSRGEALVATKEGLAADRGHAPRPPPVNSPLLAQHLAQRSATSGASRRSEVDFIDEVGGG